MPKTQETKQKMRKLLLLGILFFLSGIIAGAGSFLYGKETGEIICNTIMVLLGTGTVIFALLSSEINELFFYDNSGKYGKFTLFYLMALSLSFLFTLLPTAGWPFLIVFVILSLFSNSISGLTAGSVCLMLSVMLEENGSSREFFLYFISGVIGIMVFNRLNETFKVGIPVFISMVCLMVCLITEVLLFDEERFSISQFTLIAFNLMVNFILLLIILKIFSSSMIHRYMDRYMEINDPECPLLVQLKEQSREEYYHAIHTAYLGERIAKRLFLDDAAVKACGYYHRIGQLKEENTWENVKEICAEYHFPPDTVKILKEYVDPETEMVSRETAIILFADSIVSSILFLFSKNPKAELDYEKIIETVFRKKLASGELLKNEISVAQLREMRKIFSEEKLYYDFLR